MSVVPGEGQKNCSMVLANDISSPHRPKDGPR